MIEDWAEFSRYGMLAAAASVIHLSVPVALRFIVVGGLGAAAPTATAGFSMAIDLLQRPFAVLVAAIHAMNYPEVVVEFEHGSDEDGRLQSLIGDTARESTSATGSLRANALKNPAVTAPPTSCKRLVDSIAA